KKELLYLLLVVDIHMRPDRTELLKDGVHDSRGKKNFPVRYGHRRALNDRAVERLDQILHAGLHVEVPCQENPHIRDQVPEILLRKYHRWDELLDVALETPASKLDQCLLILIKKKTVFRAIH